MNGERWRGFGLAVLALLAVSSAGFSRIEADEPDGYPEDWGESGLELCPHVPILLPGDPRLKPENPEAQKAIADLMSCARAYLNRFDRDASAKAMSFVKTFKLFSGESWPSFFTLRQMRAFFRAYAPVAKLPFEWSEEERGRLRSELLNAELDELTRLARFRRETLRRAELQILSTLRPRYPLMTVFRGFDRYRFLLAYQYASDDQDGEMTLNAWKKISPDAGGSWKPEISEAEQIELLPLLHPFSLSGLIPEDGESALSSLKAHPFAMLRKERRQYLAGDPSWQREQIWEYQEWRDLDNPTLRPKVIPVAQAARVAMIEDGVDFQAERALLEILSDGKNDRVRSYDFADADENPWIPTQVAGLGRGTRLAKGFYDIVRLEAPAVLSAKKLDLGFWKTTPLQEILSVPSLPPETEDALWSNRPGALEAVYQAASGWLGVMPHVLWLSRGWGLGDLLTRVGNAEFLQKAPWLWVVGAGRLALAGAGPEKHCLNDVAPASRPQGRLLCVGSVRRGSVEPLDTLYGSYYTGAGIEIYTYATYDDDGSEDLSLAAGIIAAAAAVLKADQPRLTPEQIKASILKVAEKRSLKIDGNEPAKQILFFEPRRMIPLALEAARSIP